MQMHAIKIDRAGAFKVFSMAGWMWWRLVWHERRYPFNDDQETLFDLPPIGTPRSKRWGKRRERMEWAIQLLSKGYTLHVGKYSLDVGFNRTKQIVRLADRVVLEVYEIAAEMGLALTSAGEIDWRGTELTPEDFYA